MSGKNQGCELDTSYFDHVHINLPAVKRRAETLATRRTVKKEYQVGWLFKAVQCLDLTTLSGDDTPGNVQRLCFKALHPIRSDLLEKVNVPKENVKVAAVCVYPSRIKDCRDILCCEKSVKDTNTENLLHCTESDTLENTNKEDKKDEDACKIAIASVAAAFPSGQSFLEVKIAEIRHAVRAKAHEIDVVINRTHVLTGNWLEMYNELRYMKQACEGKLMKTIIAVGELGSLTNVYKASMVAMMAGSDFIKTSTGKESVNATLPVGIVMVRAIRDYYLKTKIKVGFKAAGGIRSAKDACTWLSLINEELGNDWTKPHLFRIGASALLTDIERQIFHFVYGRYAALHEMPLA